MKTLLLSILLLGASAATANAETFTFTSSAQTTNLLVVPVAGGNPVISQFSTGTSATTYASGKKSTTTNNCAGWSAAPGSPFTATGICIFTEANGDKASIQWSCIATNKEQTAANCWGGLTGMAGARENKTGTITWHQWPNADGKTGAASGAGLWND
ncbi:MAG TPA: hypothetical protein VGI79_21150 [Caulobacteraceae bacterium]